MKLAEALLLRADLQKKLASLRERIAVNAVVQDGDEPHERPDALIVQAFEILDRYERIVSAINAVNLSNKLPVGHSLTEAMAHREALAQKHAILQSAIRGSHKEPDRYSRSEIKWVATLSVSGLHQQSDLIAKEIRELNAQIQQTNWSVEIEESWGSGRA